MLLNTLATECQLYVDVKEFAKSIRVVDQITVVCSATLPTAMAVTYSVSLMHVGRNADALEVIHSLGILEDYTPELKPLVLTITTALCDCHLLDDALVFLQLLLAPSNAQSTVLSNTLHLCTGECTARLAVLRAGVPLLSHEGRRGEVH